MKTRKNKRAGFLEKIKNIFSKKPKEIKYDGLNDIEDYGAFFVRKKDNNIWVVIYIKTNYLLRHNPSHKITNFETGKMEQKDHVKGKIWGAYYDKKFRDYEMKKDVSYQELDKGLREDSQEVFNYVEDHEKLYEQLKVPGYGRKLFDKQIRFIQQQLQMMSMK